jgi:hypothetical protein
LSTVLYLFEKNSHAGLPPFFEKALYKHVPRDL